MNKEMHFILKIHFKLLNYLLSYLELVQLLGGMGGGRKIAKGPVHFFLLCFH